MRKGIRLRQEDLKEPESVSHSDVGGLYKIIILRDDYIPKLFMLQTAMAFVPKIEHSVCKERGRRNGRTLTKRNKVS